MKILAFDSWLGGQRNFKRLVPYLGEEDEIILIHLSSWSNNKYEEINLSKFRSYDISNFPSNGRKILEKVNPDLVIFLSVDVLPHMAMINASNKLSIPTVHLFHGILSVLPGAGKPQYKKKLIGLLIKSLSSLPKYIFKILPFYLRSVESSLSHVRLLPRMILNIAKTKRELLISENKCLYAMVFVESDVRYAKEVYKYQNVSVVGNPDIDEFPLVTNKKNYSNYFLFIDSVPFLRGVISLQQNIRYINALKARAKSLNLKFAIKLHPENSKGQLHDIFVSEDDIYILQKDEFSKCVSEAAVIVSDPTSLISIVFKFNRPLYFPKLKEYSPTYGEFITDNGLSRYFENVNEIERIEVQNGLMNVIELEMANRVVLNLKKIYSPRR